MRLSVIGTGIWEGAGGRNGAGEEWIRWVVVLMRHR
jgi:hypothetical protein